ncbi:MAG: 50S ribosomal protein L30 [Gammaproteobacteria bacterium]|nr:50S ribosomal protein L30 [Gammaproteobacteria bacterium]
MSDKKLRLTLCKSLNGRLAAHRACAEGLGLRKIRQTVEVIDTRENRGMVDKIGYMLKVQEI